MTEHIQPTTRPQTKEVSRPNWSAVFSVAFCVACLITVEFLPVSLLTPMAQDLGISEGVAGSPLPSPPSWRCSPACLSPR
jgi:DHA1 family purine ribonucleoside efflux pump-like MFS transporter